MSSLWDYSDPIASTIAATPAGIEFYTHRKIARLCAIMKGIVDTVVLSVSSCLCDVGDIDILSFGSE
jgi:hypothetical protein